MLAATKIWCCCASLTSVLRHSKGTKYMLSVDSITHEVQIIFRRPSSSVCLHMIYGLPGLFCWCSKPCITVGRILSLQCSSILPKYLTDCFYPITLCFYRQFSIDGNKNCSLSKSLNQMIKAI